MRRGSGMYMVPWVHFSVSTCTSTEFHYPREPLSLLASFLGPVCRWLTPKTAAFRRWSHCHQRCEVVLKAEPGAATVILSTVALRLRFIHCSTYSVPCVHTCWRLDGARPWTTSKRPHPRQTPTYPQAELIPTRNFGLPISVLPTDESLIFP